MSISAMRVARATGLHPGIWVRNVLLLVLACRIAKDSCTIEELLGIFLSRNETLIYRQLTYIIVGKGRQSHFFPSYFPEDFCLPPTTSLFNLQRGS